MTGGRMHKYWGCSCGAKAITEKFPFIQCEITQKNYVSIHQGRCYRE